MSACAQRSCKTLVNRDYHSLQGVGRERSRPCPRSKPHQGLDLKAVLPLSLKVAVPHITCNDATGNPGRFMMQATGRMIVGSKSEEDIATSGVSRMAEGDAVGWMVGNGCAREFGHIPNTS